MCVYACRGYSNILFFQLTSEHAIILFIYTKRMIDNSGQHLFDGNWQSILMISLLTAFKVWQDYSVYNSDYLQIFPNLSVETMYDKEKEYIFISKY